MALLISSEVAALSSPGTGAGPFFCASETIFQSPSDHCRSNVHVFQDEVTGSVEVLPAMPISPRYQTATLAPLSVYCCTVVPTGTTLETNVLPCGGLPPASRPILER